MYKRINMSAISYKNFAYLRGPKGDRGPQGEKGAKGDPGAAGMIQPSGRITYDTNTKIIGFNDSGLLTTSTTSTPTDGQLLSWSSYENAWVPTSVIDGGTW